MAEKNETPTTTTTRPPRGDKSTQVDTNAGVVEVASGQASNPNVIQVSVPEGMEDQFRLMLQQLSSGMHPDAIRAAVEAQQRAIVNDQLQAETADAGVNAHQEILSAMGITQQTAVTAEIALREMRKADKLEAKALRMDYAENGGQSLVNGVLVWNLTGTPVKDGESAPKEITGVGRVVTPWETYPVGAETQPS